MSFMVDYDSILVKYNEIWNKIKKTFNTKFHSMPLYDKMYLKAKVREFNGVDDKIPKEGVHHTCIVCITIDSVMRMERNVYPQVLFRRMQV